MSERSKKNDHYGKLYYNKPKRWATEYKQKEKENKEAAKEMGRFLDI